MDEFKMTEADDILTKCRFEKSWLRLKSSVAFYADFQALEMVAGFGFRYHRLVWFTQGVVVWYSPDRKKRWLSKPDYVTIGLDAVISKLVVIHWWLFKGAYSRVLIQGCLFKGQGFK
jgi:hypothetical protein